MTGDYNKYFKKNKVKEEKKAKIPLGFKIARFPFLVYKGVSNFTKPVIDPIIYSSAVLGGLNFALGATIGWSGQGLDYLVGEQSMHQFRNFVESNTVGEVIAKSAFYLGTYGVANWKWFLPAAKKTFKSRWKRRSNKSFRTWRSNIALLSVAALQLGLAYQTNLVNDISDFVKDLQQTNNYSQTIFRNARNFDKQLTGEKPFQFAFNTYVDLYNLFSSNQRKTKLVKEEEKRIKRKKTDFSYEDKISKVAEKFVAKGYFKTPEEFVYTVRVVYFEGGYDPKAGGNKEKLIKGLQGISNVIHNRYTYDNSIPKHYFTAKDKPNIFDVAFARKQFSCVKDHPKYFYEHEKIPNWDLYENNKLNIRIGSMNAWRTQLAYQALVTVLNKDAKDNTKRALFYQNKEKSDENNQDWEQTKTYLTKINSHTFFTLKNPSKRWIKK